MGHCGATAMALLYSFISGHRAAAAARSVTGGTRLCKKERRKKEDEDEEEEDVRTGSDEVLEGAGGRHVAGAGVVQTCMLAMQ